MSSEPHHGDTMPAVTDRVHHNSWSANLEGPEHADDPALVIQQSIDAIEHTEPGYHVNLVTHGDLGHPSTYLYDELAATSLDDRLIEFEYVAQCGCGGHVTKVHVSAV